MVRKLVLAVAAASALMSSGMVQALGVGDINLRSALNQPLDAEIELLQVRDLSSQEIRPALASPDEFGRAGIERDFFLTDLVFTPMVRPDGRAMIRVTSSRPVKEPFLNFLMEVRWPSGRVLREFTLLLDPPLYSPTPVTAAAPVVAPARPAPAPSSAPAPRPAPSTATSAPPPVHTPTVAPAMPRSSAPAATPSQSSGELRTSRTDTLWEIAMRSRPQGASVHQTMLAIQALNPDAFLDQNINRLKAGQTLRLPDAEQARQLSQSDAVAQVAAQNSAWQSGRQTTTTQRQLDARQQDAAPAAPSTPANGDSLRLVAGSAEQGEGNAESGTANDESRLRDQLDQTKEQLDSLEREKAEVDSRLNDMQAQMETLQRLLALKDAQLAAMQEQMGEAVTLPDIAPEPEATEPSAAPATESQDQLPPVDEAGAPADDMDAPADSLAEVPEDPLDEESASNTSAAEQPAVEGLPSEGESSVVADPAPVTADEAVTAPAAVTETPDSQATGLEAMLQRMLQNQTFLMVGGAIILLLLLLLLMALARRNARREAEMADNFIARAAENRSESVADDTDEFNVALAGFDDSDELGLDQDPLTEADALIAYGHLGKAAEVLRLAIEQDPERDELRLKLMEVEALLDNPEGYAEQVAILRSKGASEAQITALNARFPVMAAALIGAAVAVDDFREDEASVAPAVQPESENADLVDFDLGEFELDATDERVVLDEPEQDLDLDFDLDDTLARDLADPGPGATDSTLAEEELDFNLDDESVAEQPRNESPVSESDFVLDEDFDLSLTDDLQADNLMADMDAMAETPDALDDDKPGDPLTLSDDDLARFEAELNSDEPLESGLAKPDSSEELNFDDDEFADDTLTPTSTADQVLADSLAEDEEDEFDFLSGTDECATKLDLARAYIDMGDQEGARDILSEVLEEGNDQQKQDAREMMGQLD